MISEVVRVVRYYGTKYPVTRYSVEKVKNEKKANNNKPKEREYEKGTLGKRVYIA